MAQLGWRRIGTRSALAALGCASLACTGPKQLPPRAAPPPVFPAMTLPGGAPPPGQGRVALHGTDGPMRITAQADTSFVPPGGGVAPTRTGELCSSTPCAVDLPVGRYTLYLSSADGSFKHGDTDQIAVTEGVTYYMRAPGKYEPPTWFPVLPTLLAIAGAAVLTTGLLLVTSDDDSVRTPGWIAFGGGIAVLTWGSVEAYDASRAKQQEGASTIWKH